MYTILVVEDNYEELYLLTQYISVAIPTAKIDTASSYEDAIKFINANTYSCYFLDICLDENESNKNGISLGYSIRENTSSRYTPIIFITTINSKIREALNNLHCFEYISKPYSEKDIFDCIDALLGSPMCSQITLSYKDTTGIVITIDPQEIMYVNTRGHKSFIHGINNNYELNRVSLDTINKQAGSTFIQCHRSYLINPKYVDNIDLTTKQLTIRKNSVPIGRSYRNNIKDYFKL